MKPRNILVPLDGSDISFDIVPHITTFIPPQGSHLLLFHVSHHAEGVGIPRPEEYLITFQNALYGGPEKAPQIPHPVYASQVEDSLRAELEKSLYFKAKNLREQGYTVSTLVRFGQPKKEILQVIAEKDIDLVAMTTHAREGVKRLIFGSVAEHILHHVNIPVLLLHPSENYH